MPVRAQGAQAADEAYQQLRTEIVSGRLPANHRLVEAELMRELGVSRTTVRSALARLEHDGLVIREYNHGARVRMVTEAEAVELMQARSVLEGFAAREAALRATKEDIAEIEAIWREMSELLELGDVLGYAKCNTRLHSRIVSASRHAVVQGLIADLKAQMVRFQFRTILGAGRPAQSIAEHTAFVKAIAAGDADAAETAMRNHLWYVADALSLAADGGSEYVPEIRVNG